MPLRKQVWGQSKDGETLEPEYVNTDKVVRNGIIGGVESSIVASIVAATWATWISFPHPVLFSLYSSVQYFAFGFAFSGTRSLVLETWDPPRRREPYINAASGAFAGGVSANIFRGRMTVAPAIVLFGGGAFVTTHLIRFLGLSSSFQEDRDPFTISSFKKFLPFKRISDEDYSNLLKADLERVDEHIAKLDGDIANLRKT